MTVEEQISALVLDTVNDPENEFDIDQDQHHPLCYLVLDLTPYCAVTTARAGFSPHHKVYGGAQVAANAASIKSARKMLPSASPSETRFLGRRVMRFERSLTKCGATVRAPGSAARAVTLKVKFANFQQIT